LSPLPEALTSDNRFVEAALARHKREGLELAVRARIVIMSVISVMVAFITPWPDFLYYQGLTLLFVLNGLAQRRVGSVGLNRWELLLLFVDLALMTIVCLVPNPIRDVATPLAFQYHFGGVIYFFVIMASATLAYSWRTIIAVGTWSAGLWILGLLSIWALRAPPGALRSEVEALYAGAPVLIAFLDPTALNIDSRIQEIVVFIIVAVVLAIGSRRSTRLLLGQAALERERANLARYFSPNVVEELSHNDEPLKQVRGQDIAVLFVDIVGFTSFADARRPEQVITTLRDFHGLMEAEVFRHEGTLDKYLGDGLMATFGTPLSGADDAARALACALAMTSAVKAWNAERAAAGDPEIRVSFGLHYGPVVLGDIGANRLEFAVIGTTVNVASRLEALTRSLEVTLVASGALVDRARAEGGEEFVKGLAPEGAREVRGISKPLPVWTLR
jgi:adenylate cyclase